MLGMDFMVAADVVETLLHQIDLVKLFCIRAIRSWLGFERSKEAQHISHELNSWKPQPLLAKEFGDNKAQDSRNLKQKRDGSVSMAELRTAFVEVGLDVKEREI